MDGFVEDARRTVGQASASRWADGRNMTESGAIALALEVEDEEVVTGPAPPSG